MRFTYSVQGGQKYFDKTLEKQALQGDAEAQYSLGVFYYRGKYVNQNDYFALKWIIKAAEQEHPQALYAAACLIEFYGVHRCKQLLPYWLNPEQASLYFLKKASALGQHSAQSNLGFCYFHGEGISKNPKLAETWLKKSAIQYEKQHASKTPYNNLGLENLKGLAKAYFNGEEIEENIEKAFYLCNEINNLAEKQPKFKLEFFSQYRIIKKIKQFLSIKEDNKFNSNLLDLVPDKTVDPTPGLCTGFAILWLYMKRRGKEEEFYNDLYKISTWDGAKSALVEEGKKKPLFNIFEKIIYCVYLFHVNIDLPLDCTEQKTPWVENRIPLGYKQIIQQVNPSELCLLIKELEFIFVCNKEEIIAILKEIIVEGKMICLGASGHLVGIIRMRGRYHIYNPNSWEKSWNFDSIEVCLNELLSMRDIFTNEILYSAVKTVTMIYAYDILDTQYQKFNYKKNTDYAKQCLDSRGENKDINAIGGNPTRSASALLCAIAHNMLGIAKHLLDEHADPNMPDDLSNTPLHTAICSCNDLSIVDYLIKHGAYYNALNKDCNTPAYYAQFHQNKDFLFYLLNIDCLFKAARLGDLKTVRELVEVGTFINAVNKAGRTPLFEAVVGKYKHVIQYLLEQGASVCKTDLKGNTIFSMVKRKQDKKIKNLLIVCQKK